MKQNYMMTVQDVAEVLGVSIGQAYKTIRQLNKELEENGYYTVQGKVPKAFWEQKFFGFKQNRNGG